MTKAYLDGVEFVENLSTMPLDQRIYFMKALELYFVETQNDEVDFEKMLEWMSVTNPEQIEAQHLSRDLRRKLARLSKSKNQFH